MCRYDIPDFDDDMMSDTSSSGTDDCQEVFDELANKYRCVSMALVVAGLPLRIEILAAHPAWSAGGHAIPTRNEFLRVVCFCVDC